MATRAKRKTYPLSVRFSRETADFLRDEAKRTGRSRSAIATQFAVEAAHERMFPGVVFTGPDGARRVSVAGGSWDVWRVIQVYRELGSVKQMADAHDLTEQDISLALAYYEQFTEEVDEAIPSDA